jgi:hypothetical protein
MQRLEEHTVTPCRAGSAGGLTLYVHSVKRGLCLEGALDNHMVIYIQKLHFHCNIR